MVVVVALGVSVGRESISVVPQLFLVRCRMLLLLDLEILLFVEFVFVFLRVGVGRFLLGLFSHCLPLVHLV